MRCTFPDSLACWRADHGRMQSPSQTNKLALFVFAQAVENFYIIHLGVNRNWDFEVRAYIAAILWCLRPKRCYMLVYLTTT